MILETFHPLHLSLLAVTVLLPFALHFLFRKKSEVWKTNFLIVLCAVNLLIFFVYKAFLSVDAEFLRIDGAERFNWLNELPIQLCNINLFLIPIGLLTKKRFLLGFSFIIAPLGAMMALLFPEPAFHGFSLLVPRILGFYLTHALIFVCGMCLATLGFYRPAVRDFPGIVASFFVISVGAHLVNLLLRATALCDRANYFFTYGADISILNLFWRWIPYPFFYELPSLVILLFYMALVYAVFWLLERLKAHRSAVDSTHVSENIDLNEGRTGCAENEE